MFSYQKTAFNARETSLSKLRISTSASVSLILLAVSLPQVQMVHSQEVIEEINITGSRVVRDGFQAPTPVTVMTVEDMQASPPENLADFVNELPSVTGSIRPQSSQTAISSGNSGVNSMNLRGIGSNRTLTLLDGQRSVASMISGAVDVNNFPQSLVSRVEIVTGGASAAYGSDAVAGVVNYILDKDFTGFKVNVETSATVDYSDNWTQKGSITAGFPFAGARGHVLFDVEIAEKEGVMHSDRPWNREGWGQMLNPYYTPDNGQPFRLVLPEMGLISATPGGIITSGPLRGIAFGEGGAPYNFSYGDIVSSPWMRGGDWQGVARRDIPSVDPQTTRQSAFSRISYNVTDTVEIYGQAQWGRTSIENICCSLFSLGNITVRADNAFIPDSVRAQAQALGVQSFNMGTTYGDMPGPGSLNERTTYRFVLGASGDAMAFDRSWAWDTYYQRGMTDSDILGTNMWKNQERAWALDSVLDDRGLPACRAEVQGVPGAQGCVPYNLFGTGVNTKAAIEYLGIDGSGRGYQKVGPNMQEQLTQDVVAFAVSGEPFEWKAGPISLAFGGEHRREKVTGESDPISQRIVGAGWFAGNYLPTSGSYDVTEGFVETVIPLANNSSWAESLDLNAAVRLTNYSTSGTVNTWKLGMTYAPIQDVMIRATRSHDIRAPSLQDLFQAGTANTNQVRDPFNNNTTTQYMAVRTGNLNLTPEKADTSGIGVVYQPSFVSGLSMSFDYYEIEMTDALGQPGPQIIVDRCFDGNQAFCQAITRDGGLITRIDIVPFNIAEQRFRGMDYELSYRMPLSNINDSWIGNLAFRGLATRYLESYENNGIDRPKQTAGQNTSGGPPDLLYRLSLSYSTDKFQASLVGRGISSGTHNNDYIECVSNCPTSTAANNTINNNTVAGIFYTDINFTYYLEIAGGQNFEFFAGVKNLTNEKPPVNVGGPGGLAFTTPPTDLGLYDGIGRTARLGVRFRM